LSKKDPEQRTINNQVLSQIKVADWTTEINHHGLFDTLTGEQPGFYDLETTADQKPRESLDQ